VLTKLPRPVAAALEVTRDEIGPAHDAAVETDVDEFLATSILEDELGLRRAIALYSGDLFEGAEGDAAAEFCDWLLPSERACARSRTTRISGSPRTCSHAANATAPASWRRHGCAAIPPRRRCTS
jgi:hypothetical protein